MNRKLLNNILIFAAGAVIGSVVTWKVAKTKYEEEIESVKETFSGKKKEKNTEDTTEYYDENEMVEDAEDEDKETYKNIIVHAHYAENVKEDRNMDEPYVISPDEYGDSDYAFLSMVYYLDGVILNEYDKIVKNTKELIGEDFANHFGDYPDDPDVVYVRNDKLQIDFEILKDWRYYYTENEK